MGFFVLSGGGSVTPKTKDAKVGQFTFTNNTEICRTLDLDAAAGPFCVVPCTFKPRQEGWPHSPPGRPTALPPRTEPTRPPPPSVSRIDCCKQPPIGPKGAPWHFCHHCQPANSPLPTRPSCFRVPGVVCWLALKGGQRK